MNWGKVYNRRMPGIHPEPGEMKLTYRLRSWDLRSTEGQDLNQGKIPINSTFPERELRVCLEQRT